MIDGAGEAVPCKYYSDVINCEAAGCTFDYFFDKCRSSCASLWHTCTLLMLHSAEPWKPECFALDELACAQRPTECVFREISASCVAIGLPLRSCM
jgi:hypothetical protein